MLFRSLVKTSTPDGTRPRLLVLRLPLSYQNMGASGAVGADGEEAVSSTVLKPAPLTLSFRTLEGALGAALPPGVPVFAGPALSPGAVAEPEPWAVDL